MHRNLHNLNCRQITRLNRMIRRQRDLGQANRAWVRSLTRPCDLENGDEGEGEVVWTVVGTVDAEAHVDVHEGCGVPLEPAGLQGDGATADGPGCAVAGGGHTAACEG